MPAAARSKPTHKRLAPLIENVTEAATACMITMVQGNLLAITFGHWLIASRTGLISGTIATVAVFVAGSNRRWLIALLLGVTTFTVDYFGHPSHFGGAVSEAVVTALAASALSLLVGKMLTRWRSRRGADERRERS